MIEEAEKLQDEFAQSSTGDSVKVTFAPTAVNKLLLID